MNDFFNKIGLLNDDGKVSLTNTIVYTFVFIAAFRSIFSGAEIHVSIINWKIQELNISDTLPLLFSLINYGHKRQVITTTATKADLKQENQ